MYASSAFLKIKNEINDLLAGAACLNTQCVGTSVGAADYTSGQRAVCLANPGAVVGYRTGCQAMRLQKIERCESGVVQAAARIVEHTE